MIDPPWRTSTYKRLFTQEGNYLVSIVKTHIGRSSDISKPPRRSASSSEWPFLISIVKAHTSKWQIYPDEVFYMKDLLPERVTI